ncbi:MAG TPA: hypothetical protein PK063_04940 [Nitrospira sp.]|nr:hypothetical protein [Nitrospira sp.]HNG01753.1 hypothetical protein [Nitrospira sp.]HNK77386.1 hypothetical protein [Nitrospira sp.]
MPVDSDSLAAFRKQVTSARSLDAPLWEASRHLVHSADWPATRTALVKAIHASSIPDGLKQTLVAALPVDLATEDRTSSAVLLKQLTGLPLTKALRALCVFFQVGRPAMAKWPLPTVTPDTIDRFVQTHHNPFDVLLEQLPASLLDLGAGDLSFAEELATIYEPPLTAQHRPLLLHCLDRLDPSSQLGGPLHAPPLRLNRLRSKPGLEFRFYGDQDMFALDSLERDQRLAARYLIVTCWAPATPTFAYEPTRLSARCLAEELRRTKGDSRQIRHGKEPALEVSHAGRNLLFPPWKFDIRGPLALLELMASRAALCVLGAVDSQVCWEILSQLIDDPRVRPADVVLSAETLPAIFGETYRQLSALPVGGSCLLSDLTPLRKSFPSVLHTSPGHPAPYRFRQVKIQRGALFAGLPASSTARRFQGMSEETPPWLLTLVPEPVAIS